MNGIKRIIVWALLSIMVQAGVLLYLDKVYFKESSEFEIKEVTKQISTFNNDISIPEEATKIESSFSGKYVSYYLGSKLYLLDTKTGTSEEIVTNDGKREILYSKWYSETSDSLLIAEKKVSSFSKKNVINIVRFDAKNKTERELIKPDSKKPTEILYSNGVEVNAIENDVSRGITYMPVSKSGGNVKINRLDMNSDIQFISTQVTNIGTFKQSYGDDLIVYEDKKNKKFYSYTNGKTSKITMPGTNEYELLSIDNKNVAYFGEVTANKVTKIVYGTVDGKSWKTIQLAKGVSSKEIYINHKNEILVNDNLDGKVKNLSTNVEVGYEGKFISVNDKVVISGKGGKLYVKSLAEGDSNTNK